MRSKKGHFAKQDSALPNIGEFKPTNQGKTDTKTDALIENNSERSNWHWDKHDIESSTSAPMLDPESGKQVLMRRFLLTVPKEYELVDGMMSKQRKAKAPPSDEEILHFHHRMMIDNLARDGWEPIELPSIGRVRWNSLSVEDRVTLPKEMKHNWIYAVLWRCHAAYGVIREATNQKPHSVTALMNEAAKQQRQQPSPSL